MRLNSNNPLLTQPSHSALVALPTHSLWVSVSGPLRAPNEALLIFFTGAGGPSAIYIKLQQQLSSFIRVLFYDRAGYDRSTLPPLDSGKEKIYAQDTARDLKKLLSLTQLAPPYILVGHSYGGIPARAFLSLSPDDIAGIMLFDTATELMLALFQRVPPHELMAVAENVDWDALTHIRRDSGMTDEEWEYAIAAQERCGEASESEDTHGSAHRLALEHQFESHALGTRPLSVGDGTEDERRVAREFIETFELFHGQIARAQCGLSRDAEYVCFEEWGHDLRMRKPGVVVEGVRKLVERVKGDR